jgi:DNA-binding NarL/FixJ family response regulator
LILLDYSLPVVSGLEVARQVRDRIPGTKVLFLTMHDSELVVEEAHKVGAAGYMLKSDVTLDLIAAIASVAAHKPFFTSKVASTLLERFLDGPDQLSSVLTKQEHRVMLLMAEGHPSKEIAQLLGISSKTVDSHRTAIMRKLKVSLLLA